MAVEVENHQGPLTFDDRPAKSSDPWECGSALECGSAASAWAGGGPGQIDSVPAPPTPERELCTRTPKGSADRFELRQRHVGGDVVELDLHRHADAHIVRTAPDDVGQHPHTLRELDVGQHVG